MEAQKSNPPIGIRPGKAFFAHLYSTIGLAQKQEGDPFAKRVAAHGMPASQRLQRGANEQLVSLHSDGKGTRPGIGCGSRGPVRRGTAASKALV